MVREAAISKLFSLKRPSNAPKEEEGTRRRKRIVMLNAEFEAKAEEVSRADEEVLWGTMARSGAGS